MLWLAGWYPTDKNPHAGDFIRRHFKAFPKSKAFVESGEKLHLIHFAISNRWNPSGYNNALNKIRDKNCTVGEFIVPVFQSRNYLLKPFNFIWYYFIGVIVLLNYFKTHKTNYVHLHAADKVGFLAALFKDVIGYKLLYTEHWAIFNKDVEDRYERRNYWFQFYFKKVWEKTDLFVSISNTLYQSMAEVFSETKEFILVPNVLDRVFEYDIVAFPIKSSDINSLQVKFLHISNFEKRKNIPIIISAFQSLRKEFPQSTLSLVGGDLINSNELDLTSVFIYPNSPVENLIAHYRNSDVFVMYSEAENAPCVITEALSYGLPVISNDVGGISEMLTTENGIIINGSSENQFSNENLLTALLEFTQKSQIFDKIEISKKALDKYGESNVFENFYWIK